MGALLLLGLVLLVGGDDEDEDAGGLLVVGEPLPGPQRVPTVKAKTPKALTSLLDIPLYGVKSDANPQSTRFEVVSSLPPGYVPDGKWLVDVWMEVGGKPPKHAGRLDTRVSMFTVPLTVADGVQTRNADHHAKPKRWRTRVRPDGGIDLERAVRVGWHIVRARTTWTFRPK